MARDSDHLAGGFEPENTGGLLSGLLAEEEDIDRRALWRLGSWGLASVGSVIVALLANQSTIVRRDQVASVDLVRQSQQMQAVAKQTQDEARRLASAIETLNGDRDRLYSRVTMLEQGMDSVTGAIARQNPTSASPQAQAPAPPPGQASAPPPSVAAVTTEPASALQNPAPAPVVSAVAAAAAEKPAVEPATARDASPATSPPASPPPISLATSPIGPPPPTPAPAAVAAATPATPLMAAKSMLAPPDAAAGKLIKSEAPASAVTAAPMPEVAMAAGDSERDPPWAPAASKLAVQRTEFGVDVGAANSLSGLRALWRGLVKSNAALSALRPIIVVRENNNGLGMQLRLVAGPLGDAAAAAKICAGLLESERSCETAVFDGQTLAMKAEEPRAFVRPAPRRRVIPKRAEIEAPIQQRAEGYTLSSLFGKRQ